MFKNLKIGTRLAIGCGTLLTMMAILVAFGTERIGKLNDGIALVVKDRMVKTRQANVLIENLSEYGRVLRNIVLADDSAAIAEENARRAPISAIVTANLDSLEKSIDSEEARKLLAKVNEVRPVYRKCAEQIVEYALANKDDEATVILFGEMRTAQNAYIKALRELSNHQEALAMADGIAAEDMARSSGIALLLLALAAFVSGVLCVWIITRSITRALAKCIDVADRVAKGDTNVEIKVETRDETGALLASMGRMVEAIRRMGADAEALSDAAVEGRLAVRADASRHEGDFRRIIQGVNETLDSLVGFLDNMPNPCMTIDKDYQVLYMNKAGAALGDTTSEQLVRDRRKCSSFFRTGDCNSDKCACANAMRTNSAASGRTDAHPGGHNLSIQYSGVPIRDRKGNVIGAFEVVMDVTAVEKAARLAEKISRFQQAEIERLDSNLGRIAVGDLDVDLGLGDADTDTVETRAQFEKISNAMGRSVEAIRLLVADASMLSEAAVEGRLSKRAEVSRHQGDYARIVQGVNTTLDAVIWPITEAAQVLERVAERDLTARVTGDYAGDLGSIKKALNTAVDNLDKALGQVGQATLQVSSASQQISAGSQSLAQGANEQASSLEEVSASLEEMASMTRQNADNALQARSLAGEADQNARAGAEAMERMNTAIVRIKDSSDQTAKIVKTIDEIAMQTNLLALNAAVEAARAGEAGRGFAVVAEEVRNLAQRSAQAAKSTADMIGESVKNADDGVKIAQEVSRSFDSIAGSSRKVNELIGEIASASKEQSQGIDQVNTGVSQMDKVTQQTAANAEESASSAEELSSQAEELQAMVAQFKITAVGNDMGFVAVGGPHRVVHLKSHQHQNGNGSRRNVVVDRDDVVPMDEMALREF